jgi:hypothetical protein
MHPAEALLAFSTMLLISCSIELVTSRPAVRLVINLYFDTWSLVSSAVPFA